MQKFPLFWMTLFLLILSACRKSIPAISSTTGITYNPPAALPEKLITNWAYGSHPLQTLDIFLPAGRNSSDTKLLLLIHGGQWTMGDKTDMQGYVNLLKPLLPDFAFASINYRLVDGNQVFISTPQQDVARALSFLWTRLDSLHLSDKTVLLGESAGGQLALLNSYKLNSPKIKATIGIKSPTCLEQWYSSASNPQVKPLLEFITGATPVTNQQIYFDASPAQFVNTNDPATLLIHGASDGFVLTTQAIELAEKLESFGVMNKLVLFQGEAHAFSLEAQLKVYPLIADFLSDKNLYK